MNREEQRKKYLKPFKTDREESCTAQIAIRIPPSKKAKLKKINGWQEELRKYIDKMVEPKSA